MGVSNRGLAALRLALLALVVPLALVQCATGADLPFLWPVAGEVGYITALFGKTLDPSTPGAWYDNKGIDIDWRSEAWVVAALDGRVTSAILDPNTDSGGSVVLSHPNALTTRYANLHTILVRPNQAVRRGQRLGTMGTTALPYPGFRLHFEVMRDGVPIDPMPVLEEPKR